MNCPSLLLPPSEQKVLSWTGPQARKAAAGTDKDEKFLGRRVYVRKLGRGFLAVNNWQP
jgi:hypothetical protein